MANSTITKFPKNATAPRSFDNMDYWGYGFTETDGNNNTINIRLPFNFEVRSSDDSAGAINITSLKGIFRTADGLMYAGSTPQWDVTEYITTTWLSKYQNILTIKLTVPNSVSITHYSDQRPFVVALKMTGSYSV